MSSGATYTLASAYLIRKIDVLMMGRNGSFLLKMIINTILCGGGVILFATLIVSVRNMLLGEKEEEETPVVLANDDLEEAELVEKWTWDDTHRLVLMEIAEKFKKEPESGAVKLKVLGDLGEIILTNSIKNPPIKLTEAFATRTFIKPVPSRVRTLHQAICAVRDKANFDTEDHVDEVD